MKVIAYVRVSTEEQEQSGLGLEAQREKIETYCKLKDLELVKIVEDSISAKSLNRPGIEKVLQMVRKREIDGVVVYKFDRMFRSTIDALNIANEFNTLDIAFHSITESIDTTTPHGEFFYTIIAAFAQLERKRISERTRDALRAKRKRGEKTGGDVPFGYDLAADGRLVENTKEHVVIQQIKILRDKGYGYQRTAYALNQLGHRTKRGKLWNQVTAGRLVRRIEDGRF